MACTNPSVSFMNTSVFSETSGWSSGASSAVAESLLCKRICFRRSFCVGVKWEKPWNVPFFCGDSKWGLWWNDRAVGLLLRKKEAWWVRLKCLEFQVAPSPCVGTRWQTFASLGHDEQAFVIWKHLNWMVGWAPSAVCRGSSQTEVHRAGCPVLRQRKGAYSWPIMVDTKNTGISRLQNKLGTLNLTDSGCTLNFRKNELISAFLIRCCFKKSWMWQLHKRGMMPLWGLLWFNTFQLFSCF